jgi:hypothetical protein
MGVVIVEEAIDRGLEVGDGLEDSAFEAALRQGREENHRRPARLLHPDRMRKLLQKRRIRFSLTRSRFSSCFLMIVAGRAQG